MYPLLQVNMQTHACMGCRHVPAYSGNKTIHLHFICAVVPGKKKTKEYRKKKNSRVYMILGEWNFLFVSSLTVVFHTIIWQIKEKIIHKDEFQT